MTHYVGSFGDGHMACDNSGYTNASDSREKYGCGGCSINGSPTPTPECPEPTFGWGAGPNHRGIFNYLGYYAGRIIPPVAFKNITDGTSYTILMGHTSGLATAFDNVWTAATGNSHGTGIPINFNIGPSYQQGSNYLGPGGSKNYAWRSKGFQSHHPGGSIFTLCDGSVLFIEENIDQKISTRRRTTPWAVELVQRPSYIHGDVDVSTLSYSYRLFHTHRGRLW